MSGADALHNPSFPSNIIGIAGDNGEPEHEWAYSPWHGTHLKNLRIRSTEKHSKLHITEEASPETRAGLATSLHTLRNIWDLPVAWLARILRVERQTIYAWMKGIDVTTTSPRQNNALRLQQLHLLGAEWKKLSDDRFSRKHAMVYFGTRNLLEWIEQSELDSPVLIEYLKEVSRIGKNHELVRTLSQSMYRGPAHPEANKQRLLDRRFIGESKE